MESLEQRELLASSVVALPNVFGTQSTIGVAPAVPVFQLAPELAELGSNGSVTSFSFASVIGQTTPRAVVTLKGKFATADSSGRYTIHDVPLNLGVNTLTAVATLNGLKKTFTTKITRVAVPQGVTVLKEEGRFLTAATMQVSLGAGDGTRALQFDIQAVLNRTDKAASGDALLISIVDPENPATTLLSSRGPGSPIFSFTETGTEFQPGLVQFDGRTLNIDVTGITGHATGTLLFQLISADVDTNSEVHISPIQDLLDPDGVPGPTIPDFVANNSANAGAAVNFKGFAALAGVRMLVSNVQFDDAAKQYRADLSLRNDGAAIVSQNVAALFPGLPASVQIANATGVNAKSVPYLNFASAIPSGGLARGQVSDAIPIVVNDPNLLRFALRPSILGSFNKAPTLPAILPKTVFVGGHLEINLGASDVNGDAIVYTVRGGSLPTGQLHPDGTLIIAPAPGDEGVYNFTVVASDGNSETTRPVKITVAEDANTATRVSGFVLNVDGTPIPGMTVEIGAVQGLTMDDGSFLLDLGPGIPASLTIKVRGELYADGNYPFIAEKIEFILGHPIYDGANNVIARPIFLPTLNDGQIVDPSQNQTISSTDPNLQGASVFVAAGTLLNSSGQQFTGELSITEVPIDLTPAALPDNLLPDLVVTIQPGEMLFAVPAGLTLPNRAGYAPGTIMDLWSINPSTGEFDLVGQGQVSADGTVIVTISGGVRNSSWHFFTPPPPPPDPPEDDDLNEEPDCPGESAPANSEVELHSGALTETHALVTYQSLGETRGVTLAYKSLRADPRPVLHFGYSNVTVNANRRLVARLVQRRGDFEYVLPGFEGGMGLPGGEHFWLVDQAGKVRVALQTDFRDLPSGTYQYDLTTGLLQLNNGTFTGSTSTQTGEITIVNSRGSVFGNGWEISGLLRIVENPNGSLILINGNGGEHLFHLQGGADLVAAAAGDQEYDGPEDDFTTLIKHADGTFTRTHIDHTVERFDALGRLVSITDRNGNATQYQYNQFGLSKIIDPDGLATTLVYAGGKVTRIVDPANRATVMTYDARGNLKSITNPDGATRTWDYDDDFHLTGETDARGNRETSIYNFAGQVVGAVKKDGRRLHFDPAQSHDLHPAELTSNPNTAPSLFAATQDAVASYTDANGNVVRMVLDQHGQMESARDGGGLLPAVERNDQHLVSQQTDGRGNATDFVYDDFGNLISMTQQLTSLPGGAGGLRETRNDTALRTNAGFFTNSLAANDDGSTGFVPIGFDVNFFGTNYTGVFVNNNGNVTFDSALSTFTPFNLLSTSRVLIAPFFADVDTRGAGTVKYGQDVIDGYNVFAINWTAVGYYPSGTDKLNNFQLVLIDRSDAAPGDFDFELNYGQVQWETGGASGGSGGLGGNSARAGYSNGQNASFELVGSAINGAFLDSNETTGLIHGERASIVSGRYRFEVHNGEVLTARRQMEFDDEFNQLTSVTDELGHKTLFDLDSANGNVLKSTRVVGLLDSAANGQTDDIVSAYTYNARGQLATYTDPLGRVVQNEYDALGRLIQVTRAVGTADQAIRRWEYDGAGNTKADIDELGRRTVFFYDPMNRVTRIVEADPDGSGPLVSPNTIFGYDPNGNHTRITDPRGNVVLNHFDALDRLTSTSADPDGAGPRTPSISLYSYDAVGNILSSTDPLGKTTVYAYDSRNRRISITDPDGGVTRFRYDQDDNVTRITDAVGNITDFGYDSRSRLVREADPLGEVITYRFDAANNLRTKTDRNGRTISFNYDELNRLIQENWVVQGQPAANVINFAYDKAGNLLNASDAFSALSMTYDARDRVKTVANMGTPGAPVVALAYQYDTLGNVTHVVDTIDGNAGVGTAYVYDHLNRLKTLTQAGTDTSEKRVDFSYNNLGQYTQIARFANLAGTISVANSNYAYDGMNRLTSLTHQRGVGVIDSYGYTYDADSRITRIVSALDGATDYTYDDRDQLTGAEYANAAIPDENFDFDANGNRVASHLHGTGYVTGPGNRLLSDGTFNYEYDGEGNMTKRTNIADGTYREFGWDHRNRLISVTDRSSGGVITNEVTFAYDAMNRRIAKTANGASTLFVYDREDVLLDFADADAGGPGAPVLESRNLHGTGFDEVVAEDHGGGDVHWLLADHLGSTRNVVNASGSLVNHTLVDSYGTVLSQTNPVSDTRFIFTGREFDQESDIHYFRRRYLDPQIGRFLGEDPTRVFGADANPYRYVSNIPILQVDPFGLWGVGVTAGGSVEGGVVVGSGATVSGGVGVFGGGSQGINTGGYVSGGAYSGTPGNNVGYPGGQNVQTGNGVIGGYAGVGVGGFITNATSACQLSGPFSTWSINTPWGSAQFGYSDGTWIGSITVGPGIGGGVSGYPTNTYVP